jgi:putative membrane protein
VRALILIALIVRPSISLAHEGPTLDALDACLAALLVLSFALYVNGARNLWFAAPGHRRLMARACVSFLLGWLLLALALLPPLATLSAETFSGHMLQHEVLMLGSAPLLVLGRPLALWTWSLPPAWRAKVAKPVRTPAVLATWRFLTAPLAATVLHAAALWAWHVPAFFAAAQANVALHAIQHAAFFFSALLFWNAVLEPRESATGPAVFWLFITMLHTGALGVLLTFSGAPWYPADSGALAAWGLTPLTDQQLGGVIMWVPGGTIYVIAALALAARWLGDGRRNAGATS